MAKATATKKQNISGVVYVHTPAGKFAKGSGGRRPGSKNKTAAIQRQTAMEAFEPLAKQGLTIGKEHLENCGKGDCPHCQYWAGVAFRYHFGLPKVDINIDIVALNNEIDKLAAENGTSREEIEREAERFGITLLPQRTLT